MKTYRYLDLITAAFVAVLIISNVAATKVVVLGPFTFDGGTLLFPLAYIFGDVLTEVYGYARSRRVIWTGFALLALASLTFSAVAALPALADPELAPYAEAFDRLFGLVPRIVLGSLLAYWAGEFANSYVLAKMKVRSRGRFFGARALGSTLVGEAVDTGLFLLVAFAGVYPTYVLGRMFASNYVFKVGVEVVFLPLTYAVVGALKRSENEDYFDTDTDFNPFHLGG
ncbi:MAG TPA: VUT family protein [Oceanithermus profundus]|uniref:Probable queuosine precursor transporter n=1 Tax=Oceanithermus profundus TaxID=187137 RepID=A0A7C4Z5G6_9DEIN|nr:VUT family protein [Oceanithermus profundus]